LIKLIDKFLDLRRIERIQKRIQFERDVTAGHFLGNAIGIPKILAGVFENIWRILRIRSVQVCLLALPPLGSYNEHVCHSDIHIVCTKRLARNVNIKLGPRSLPRDTASTFNLSSNPSAHMWRRKSWNLLHCLYIN